MVISGVINYLLLITILNIYLIIDINKIQLYEFLDLTLKIQRQTKSNQRVSNIHSHIIETFIIDIQIKATMKLHDNKDRNTCKGLKLLNILSFLANFNICYQNLKFHQIKSINKPIVQLLTHFFFSDILVNTYILEKIYYQITKKDISISSKVISNFDRAFIILQNSY